MNAGSLLDGTVGRAKAGRQRTRGFVAELVLGVLILLVVATTAGLTALRGAAKQDAVVQLRNSVEELAGASVKAFSLRLPADGNVNLDVLVHHGPGITVHLISRTSTSTLKVNEFRFFSEFSAEQVTACRRTGWLPRGEYYLTVVNPASDPAVVTKVRLSAYLTPAPKKA